MREVRRVDDERLLIVATDRISAYDWIMPTPIPDKGRVLTALSAFWFATHGRHRPQPPDRAVERAGDAGAAAGDAAGGVRGPRLPGRLGLARLRGDRRGLRPPAPAGPAPGRPPARADLHPGDEGHRGPRPQHHPRARRPTMVGADVLAEAERITLALYARGRRASAAAPG